MLEFDMPVPKDDYEILRYFRISEALEASGIPFGKRFGLDIEKGVILETLIKRTELKGFQKRFGFGCPVSREAPHFEYSYKCDGIEIIYRRGIQTAESGFYSDGVACLGRMVSALNDKGNCWEDFSFYERMRTAAKVFRDAVNLALDFYQPKNI